MNSSERYWSDLLIDDVAAFLRIYGLFLNGYAIYYGQDIESFEEISQAAGGHDKVKFLVRACLVF